jgi:SAM-dependent methyltransferase
MSEEFHLNNTRELEVYRCVICKAGPLVASSSGDREPSGLVCSSCQAAYPVVHNVLDTMIRPSHEVLEELQGMAVEQGRSREEWNSVRIRHLDVAPTFASRLRETEGQAVEYYQQTQQHFEQALRDLGINPRRVLEIGSETDYFFLQHFRDRGARCHAVNISFMYQEPDVFLEWPEKTLADMNELPFQDGVFDLVMFSATLHHSPDLKRTMREVARVTSSTGTVLVLSEQIGGWLKRSDRYAHRSDQIHETYRSFLEYHSSFTRAGLRAQYLFSEHFDKKLRERKIHPEGRYANLGNLVARMWKHEPFRKLAHGPGLYVAHTLFGFPLNVILRKNHSARHRPKA